MNPSPIYVLDTHALVWFLKRDRSIGRKALKILLSGNSHLVAPIYLIDEIRLKSLNNNYLSRRDRIGLPPATVLRLLLASYNIKVFPRSPAVIFEEEKLRRAVTSRRLDLSMQDIPICATALAIQKVSTGSTSIVLITKDDQIRRWAKIPAVWN